MSGFPVSWHPHVLHPSHELMIWSVSPPRMLYIYRAVVLTCAFSTIATAWRSVWGGHASFRNAVESRSYHTSVSFASKKTLEHTTCETFDITDKGSVLNELMRLAKFSGRNSTENGALFLRHAAHNFRERPPPQEFLTTLLNYSIASHKMLPNVVSVNRARNAATGLFTTNLTVVGDTHGQYEDVDMIFENDKIGGFPSPTNHYIFNGDMVDRGEQGVEIVTMLLLAKLLYPDAVHILRGNHETRFTTKQHGFQNELRKKYDKNYYRNIFKEHSEYKGYKEPEPMALIDKFMEFFDTLPIAAVVENKTFVVHGGLGMYNVNMTVAEINHVNRFREATDVKVIDQLLWSDPKEKLGAQWSTRPPFGPDVTKAFLSRNGLQLLIRSHECRMEGYDVMHDGRTVTVFSAPKYCGVMKNKAAVVRFDQAEGDEPAMVQYSECDAKKPHYERHNATQAGIQWQGLQRTSAEYNVSLHFDRDYYNCE